MTLRVFSNLNDSMILLGALLSSLACHLPALAPCLPYCLPILACQLHINCLSKYSTETPRYLLVARYHCCCFSSAQDPPSSLQCSSGKNGYRGKARHANSSVNATKTRRVHSCGKTRWTRVSFLLCAYLPELLPQTERRYPASLIAFGEGLLTV